VVTGVQVPRVWSAPPAVSSRGREAVELAASAGLLLDPWQVFVLEHGLGVREDGRWAAFELGILVPRQNGKGGVIEALELGGLFLWSERFLVHSAHQFDTSLEAFTRLADLIEGSADLSRQVQRMVRSHGEEGITLTNGQRIRFRTRTKGGGRGFTGDRLILDEAMILPERMIGALLPTLSARPNPQVVYAGSAVDRFVHEDGVVFARVRERGLAGGDPSLAFFEHSVEHGHEDGRLFTPDDVEEELAGSAEAWAQANPALGIRISSEHIEHERRSMAARTFAVERLGVGDWPTTDETAQSVIDLDAWNALEDIGSITAGQVSFAFDVTPDRSACSIAVGGRRADGLAHVEVVEHRRGTGWLVRRLAELNTRHSPSAVLSSGSGIVGSLVSELEQAGVQVVTLNATEYAQACASLVDGVEEKSVRHLGQKELRDAVKGAATRPLGDAWAWSRKSSSVDISPLVAGTLAFWGAVTAPSGDYILDIGELMAS
jgi:phage terminase large subunit-like protein